MAIAEIKVPDIGGFNDVPVIEVLVAAGDTIEKDSPLVSLESDKATMEVPSTLAGVVKDVKVKVGDKAVSYTHLTAAVMAVYTSARLTMKSMSKKWCLTTAIHTTITGMMESDSSAPFSQKFRYIGKKCSERMRPCLLYTSRCV